MSEAYLLNRATLVECRSSGIVFEIDDVGKVFFSTYTQTSRAFAPWLGVRNALRVAIVPGTGSDHFDALEEAQAALERIPHAAHDAGGIAPSVNCLIEQAQAALARALVSLG